jgi:hypothetical protein
VHRAQRAAGCDPSEQCGHQDHDRERDQRVLEQMREDQRLLMAGALLLLE